jgi:hypothetical protein
MSYCRRTDLLPPSLSPSGLNFVTDEMLTTLLSDIDAWKHKLPESLQFKGPDTPTTPGWSLFRVEIGPTVYPLFAGLLHLLYTCVHIAFWRVFLKFNFVAPPHITFGLTSDRWEQVVKMADESIEWLDRHDKLYDVWMLVSYAATSCALAEVRVL